MEQYRETYPKFCRPGTWVHGKQWAVAEEEGRHHLTIPPNNLVASVLGAELCRNCTGITVHRLDVYGARAWVSPTFTQLQLYIYP